MRRRYSWYVAMQSRSIAAPAPNAARVRAPLRRSGRTERRSLTTSRADLLLQRRPSGRARAARCTRPSRAARRSGLDEPHGDSRLVAGAAHAARQHVAARRAASRPLSWLGPYQLAWLAMTNRSSSSSRSMISSVMLAAKTSSATSALEILERNDDDARPLGALRLAEHLERTARFAQRRLLPSDDADCADEHRDQTERDAPPRERRLLRPRAGSGCGRRHAHRSALAQRSDTRRHSRRAATRSCTGSALAFARVILDQSPAQTARLDAHQRIGLRVEIGGPAEHLDADRVTLQPLTGAGQRLLDDEAQEIATRPFAC